MATIDLIRAAAEGRLIGRPVWASHEGDKAFRPVSFSQARDPSKLHFPPAVLETIDGAGLEPGGEAFVYLTSAAVFELRLLAKPLSNRQRSV